MSQLQYISARTLCEKSLRNLTDGSFQRQSVSEIYGRTAVYLLYQAFGKDCSRQSYCISSIRGGQPHNEIRRRTIDKRDGLAILLFRSFKQAERGARAKGKPEGAQAGRLRVRRQGRDALSENLLRQVVSEGTGEAGAAPGGAFLWVLSCRDKKVPRPPGRDRVNTLSA